MIHTKLDAKPVAVGCIDRPGLRLGNLQLGILEALQLKGRWMTALDVTCQVYVDSERLETDGEEISRAFYVAVRRAINSLAKAGLIRIGQPVPEMAIDQRTRLACWLPEHRPPEEMTRKASGQAIRDSVLEYLRGISEVEAAESRSFHQRDLKDQTPHKMDIHYGSLAIDILNKYSIDAFGENRFQVAISRAVTSLEKQGLIVVTRRHANYSRPRAIMVRLSGVAM